MKKLIKMFFNVLEKLMPLRKLEEKFFEIEKRKLLSS